MSLVVTVYVPGGIVIAGDSRTTVTRVTEQRQQDKTTVKVHDRMVLSDNSYKVVALSKVPVGVGHTGAAIINNQSVESHVLAFEEERVAENDTPHEVAQALSTYFREKFPKVPVRFYIAGYTFDKGLSTPHVYTVHTIEVPEPTRLNIDDKGQILYGVARGGDVEIVNRLVVKEYLPAFAALPLQDAIDYAIYLIDVTIQTMRFEPRPKTVGVPIDVLLITPDKIGFVQRKQLHGKDLKEIWSPELRLPSRRSTITKSAKLQRNG
jgi:hypothetical protein